MSWRIDGTGLSLRSRLLLLTMFTSGMCLGLGCAAFLIYDRHAMRIESVEELNSTASMIGTNASAALAFDDPTGAEQLLQALRTLAHVRRAALYNATGKLFATYHREDQGKDAPFPSGAAPGVEWTADSVRAVSPVMLNGRQLGSLYVESDLYAMQARTRRFTNVTLLVMTGMFALAYFLTAGLQRSVTEPIRQLAEVARSIAVERQYGLRAPPLAGGELRQLGADFNYMLEEIERRDAALVEARNTMELRVVERTQELEEEISERSKAESALRERTTYLNTVIDGCPIGLVGEDENEHIQMSNQAFRELFGYSGEEMAGKSIDELIAPRELQTEARKFSEEVLSGSIVHKTVRRRHKSGLLIDVEAYGVPFVVDGVLRGQVALYQDISEQVRAQKALADSEERFRTLSAVAPVGIALVDTQGKVSYVNEHYLTMAGLSSEEALNGGWRLVVHPEDLERIDRLRSEAIRQGEDYSMSYRYLTRDQRVVWVDTVARAFFHKDGRQQGYVVVVQDVTERQNSAEKLKRAKEAAEAASQAKSEFLANMSHEIRTPMNGIIGMTELALDTELTQEQRDYLGMVQSSAKSLLGIINDILDFSKIEAGKLDIEKAPFSLFDCIEGALQPLVLRAQQKGLELTWTVEPQIPEWLQGDSTRLRQVLINLVGNAIKFTREGEVSVRAEKAAKAGGRANFCFVVSDTGIGIPREKHQKIFEAFAQADASTTREFGGTGLGLSISSRLVKLMGGEIWLESAEGKGTQFFFTVPFGEARPPAAKHNAEDFTILDGKDVLVVDDHEVNRKLLAMLLPQWGLTVETAEDGYEGLRKFEARLAKQDPFSIVLLDSNMPRMNGLETAQRLRVLAGQASAAILMLTSSPRNEDPADSQKAGICCTLGKPIQRAELRQAMTAALAGSGRKAPSTVGRELAPMRPRRLLLVEDNAVNQRLAVRLLEKMGHRVTLSSNGKEALEWLAKEDFDLVLMDIQMPVMGGVEATTRIREMEMKSGKRVPILAMTAHAIKGDREKYLASGMDGYISKPIRVDVLRDEVSRLVSPSGHESRGLSKEERGDEPSTAQDVEPTARVDVRDLLGRVENDRGLLRDLVEIFRKDVPQYLSALEVAVNGGDAKEVGHGAHALKGMLGNLAATRAAAAAAHLEILGKNGDRAEFAAALKKLQEEMSGLLPELDAVAAGEKF